MVMGLGAESVVVVKFIVQGARNIQKAVQNIEKAVQNIENNFKGLNKVMSAPLERFNAMTTSTGNLAKRGKGMNTVLARMGHAFRQLTHGAEGFRMEMLGVMFFGMMLQRTFIGLLRPAMEVFGVFDLWSVMLQVVFLPVLALLFPYFLSLIDFFMNLPESVQLAIGVFVLLGVVLGTFLMIIGQLALGLGSLVLLWTGKFIALPKLMGMIFGGISATFLAFLAIAVAIVIGIWLAWKENFLNIRVFIQMIWDGIKNIFEGAIGFITNIFKAFFALLKGDTAGFKKYAWEAIKHLGQLLAGIGQLFVGVVVTIFIGAVRAVAGVLVVIKDLLWSAGSWLIEWGKKAIEWIIEGLKAAPGKLMDALKGLFGGGGGGSSGKSVKSKNVDDFIWRPGQSPVSISPSDTLIGAKKGLPSSGEISITQNISITGSLKEEIERAIAYNNTRLVDDLRRMMKSNMGG